MSITQTASAKPLIPVLGSLTHNLAPLSEPLVRVTAGLFLLPHGAQKLFGWFGGYGVEATGQFFETKLGLPASLALLAGLIEFFGGIMLALGLLTRPVAALVFGLMVVAAVQVHVPLGFFWTDGGFEYPLLWALISLSVMLRGGGRYSIDGMIGLEV